MGLIKDYFVVFESMNIKMSEGQPLKFYFTSLLCIINKTSGLTQRENLGCSGWVEKEQLN